MKNLKLKKPTLLIFAIAVAFLASTVVAQQPPATAPINLVAGVGGPVSSSNQWSNYSALNLIAGAFIFPAVASVKTTVLYIGFTAGTEADLGNMVLYTTKRGNSKITAVTSVKLKGVSNPIISLTNKKVCPTQPVSVTNPCVVRLDPMTLTLSTLSDYYFVMYLSTSNKQRDPWRRQCAISDYQPYRLVLEWRPNPTHSWWFDSVRLHRDPSVLSFVRDEQLERARERISSETRL